MSYIIKRYSVRFSDMITTYRKGECVGLTIVVTGRATESLMMALTLIRCSDINNNCVCKSK